MADDTSPQNKLKQIISRLSIHCNLTGEDIADVLWLALKQKESSTTELQENVVPPVEDKQENEKQSDSSIVNDVQSEPLQDSTSSTLPEEKPSAQIYPPSQGNSSSSISQKTIPLRHPDPPSLQQPLEFAKTLGPLIRRVDSGRKTVLDEVETVKRTAEEGICIPILKSESEPWLDLALVVDENSSMIIWGNTVKELKQLLEHYGIFRKVRTWGLTTDKEGDITLRVQVGQKESFKNPQELIDPTHRRLILIVSDCVGPIWFDGTILSTLDDWSKYQPMAIVQMLPDSMWLRTGLRLGSSVKLVNLIPGAANHNLLIHELLLWKDINLERGTKIPVLTLNPEVTSLWSDFLIGKYDRIMAGFVFPSASDFTPPPQLAQSRVKELNAEQRVERFRKISSPLGRKLAGLLMAAPVITLPVVRLIQKTLLPKSQPVHVAEVFLGGLLKPRTQITIDINPDGVLFDIIDDRIRNILLDDAPFGDSVIIFHTISDYIESQLGKSLRECVGLLIGESEDGKEETVAKAYAEISLKVLKAFGGEYARFAEEIKDSTRDYSQKIDQENIDYLYEAKLIIVGAGGAGKNTLANKIINPEYKLNPQEASTEGIDILKWSFPIIDKKGKKRDFKVNIWDFGGQEIYHTTYQFFLTKCSLYALVVDTRKEDTDFPYWLNIVQLLSDYSPLIIVKNEKGDRTIEINELQLRGQFINLKEVLACNFADNRGLNSLKQKIKYYLTKLPHVGDVLPKTWKKVRETLEQDKRNYMVLPNLSG